MSDAGGADERYYSVRDVAERLGVGVETVQRWIRRKELAAIAFGGRMGYRVQASELERFIARRTVAAEVGRRLEQ